MELLKLSDGLKKEMKEMDNNCFTLITGASTGIGRAIAREMASRKHNLILHSLPGENLPGLCKELTEDSRVQALFFETDLTAKDGPQSLFDFVKENGFRVNILVNNAGIGFDGIIENYSLKEIDDMILLNIRALTLLTHFFTGELKSHTKSYILFISSFGTYTPTSHRSIYLATKSYIYYLARALQSEFRGTSLRTCVILPSAVRTNTKTLDRIQRGGWTGKVSALSPEEVAQSTVKGMLKGRKVIIPGSLTNLFFLFGILLPEGIILKITHRIFSK
jgi:hypothetical protein